MMKVFLVAGARPNFMKIAPLVKQMQKDKKAFVYKIIHTGQHYDYRMNEVFFRDLQIPSAMHFLNSGSASHAVQTAKIMTRFEKVCISEKPDLVIVVGDVNSTLACSIVARKLSIAVAHIEAGLRSYDKSMPEEINRIVTDSISDYFFISEKAGYNNLLREGKNKKDLFFVGNVMIDTLFYQLNRLKKMDLSVFATNKLKSKFSSYACLTLHRPSNVDRRADLVRIMSCIETISKKIPVLFPVHPRTQASLKKFKVRVSPGIILLPALSYLEFLNLWKDSKFVLTDSGGLQEETTALKVPCFTLRKTTERPVTVTKGTNIVVGEDYSILFKKVCSVLKGKQKKGSLPPLWDGKASIRIVRILKKLLNR